MSGRLAGKVSVITGAGQGIGRAAALAFVAAGSTVWAVDRNPEALTSLQTEQPAIKIKALDVTDGPGITRFADEVGPIDALFNCAGFVHAGGILDCTEADWDQAMNVNARSMFLMTKAFLPGMVDNGAGSIINMSSVVSSVMGVPGRFAYGTSKAAVVGLTKSIAADFVDKGIRCNAIAPGTVDSPSLGERLAVFDDPVAARAEFVARQPMGRLGTAEEIAALALYLASDEAAYTTGSVHVVDGGMSL
jgi:2-keto-3-deoxy-L-fuconate dehydrogenase